MSISPINHYALTTAQPGVINEEAYTVLDLVGKCGAKVNECVNAVNEIEDYDDRITAAQETADEAASTARAAMTTATENGQRITNVSAVAMEGRSVAFSAQSAANAAQTTADAANAIATKAYTGMVELEQVTNEGAGQNYIDQYGNLSTTGKAYVKGLLNKCMAKIKINLLQQVAKTYHFIFGVNGSIDANMHNNGYVDIFINLIENAYGHNTVGFAFKILCAATPDSQNVQAEGITFSYESSGGINYANFTANGIGPNDFFISDAGFGNEIPVRN